MQRVRVLPWMCVVLAIAWPAYTWWGHGSDASLPVWIASALAVAGAVLGAVVPARFARAHVTIAAGLMLCLASYAATKMIGRWPFAWDAMADRRYAGFITTTCVVVAIGLVRRALWARWAAIAVSAAGILGSTLNSIHMRGTRDESLWLAGIGVAGGVTILVQLSRSSVRELFAKHAKHALWASRDRLVRSARWAAISNLAAAPMLLLYALGQPVAPQTVISALVLAPILGIGSALIMMRRALGVVILAIGGLALVGHTIATAEYVIAANLPIVGYYAVFWLPAAALGLLAGMFALRRTR